MLEGREFKARTSSPARWCVPAIGALLLLAGCAAGPDAADRSAASAVASNSASSIQAPDAGASEPAKLFTKPVKWCFTNNAEPAVNIFFGSSMYPQHYQVGATIGGSSGDGGPIDLLKGQTACSTHSSSVGEDVEASITFANGRRTAFAAYNPSVGPPEFFWDWTGDMVYGLDSFEERQTRSYDRHYNKWDVTRLMDTDNKEFRIVFQGPSDPA